MSSTDDKTSHTERSEYTRGEVEILVRIERLEAEIRAYRDQATSYVRKEEFQPVRMIVYGMVGIILLSFIGAIVALVLR